MRVLCLWSFAICSAFTALAQHRPSETITLPADKSETDILLRLPSPPDSSAKPNFLPLARPDGKPISQQPVFTDPALNGDTLLVHVKELLFWGPARLQLQLLPGGGLYTYTLQRGPEPATKAPSYDVQVERATPAQLWLYNYDTQPVNLRWRIISGPDTLCGIDSKGQALRDCSSVDKWAKATLGPARSDSLAFVIPDWWFNPWKILSGDARDAELELRFGEGDAAPLLRVPLKLHLDIHLADVLALWFPWTATVWSLLWVTFWVTLGAVFLMMAQVMIPNFRQCLRMEGQIDNLQNRLQAIGGSVGIRLQTRCQQELASVRQALVMGPDFRRTRFFDRVALSGNTAEVNRLAGLLPRIESRISLTERLDEQQSDPEGESRDLPPSLCWERARQIRSVKAILSGQFVSDADERAASAMLDSLADPAASLKAFAPELETRIAGLRRQFDTEPWKSRYESLKLALTGCDELLKKPPDPIPDGGWNTEELTQRDAAAIRLELVYQMIALAPLLTAHPELSADIRARLDSNDPGRLAGAQCDLVKVSQGWFEQDVRRGLEEFLWDAYFEPVVVTDQDVLKASFVLRNTDLDRCAAKNSFQCYWRISAVSESGVPLEADFEQGWKIELIPQRGKTTISPEVYDAVGHEVAIRPPTEEGDKKGSQLIDVGPPLSNALRKRLLRGLLDAALTALVPVVSVAITHVNSGGDLSAGTLVVLGFTSQAIRTVIVPDPVAPSPDAPPPAKTPTA